MASSKVDFAQIKLLLLDVDGVLTDGKVYYGESGASLLPFYIPDGMGMVLLQRAGIKVAVMTTTEHDSVRSRMENLKVQYFRSGILSKGEELPKLLEEAGVEACNVAYVSDDINDISALEQVGVVIAVANAQEEVKAMADYVTQARGGEGAVREVCNQIMKAKGLDPVKLWEHKD